MKNAFIVTLVTAFVSVAVAPGLCDEPSFEGTIWFQLDVEITDSRVSEDDVADFGTSLVVFYRSNGDIRKEWTDAAGEWELYLADENTQIGKMRDDDSKLFSWDGAREDRKLLSVKRESTDESALGRGLDVVTIKYDDGTQTRYWFDPSLYADPRPYSRLRFAYQNRYWELAKAPILMYERTTQLYRITHTPLKMEIAPVSDELFTIPDLPVEPF